MPLLLRTQGVHAIGTAGRTWADFYRLSTELLNRGGAGWRAHETCFAARPQQSPSQCLEDRAFDYKDREVSEPLSSERQFRSPRLPCDWCLQVPAASAGPVTCS